MTRPAFGALIHLHSRSRRNLMIHPSSFLRRALQADAVFSGLSAVVLTLGAADLAPLTNLPEALLRETGLFLIAYAAFVGWLGMRTTMPRILVAIVIAGNAAWTLASIVLLFSDVVTPNLLGEFAIAIQAIAVGALAELQYTGLRRSGGAVAA
jgi:uncharacterized protein YjeT (DUF2065 family)